VENNKEDQVINGNDPQTSEQTEERDRNEDQLKSNEAQDFKAMIIDEKVLTSINDDFFDEP